MTILLLAVVAVLAASQTPKQQPSPPTVVKVRIVVDSLNSLTDQCAQKKFLPTDVLVNKDEKQNEPYHCSAAGKLLGHKVAHGEAKETLVRLSVARQDSVEWSSTVPFSVESITPRDPKPPDGVPQNPFGRLALKGTPNKVINSGPITSKAAVGYQYKIVFRMGNRSIDPDVWCDP